MLHQSVERLAVKRWAAVRGRPSASTACSTAHRQGTRTPSTNDHRKCVASPMRAPSAMPIGMRILDTSPAASAQPPTAPGSWPPRSEPANKPHVRRTVCRSAANPPHERFVDVTPMSLRRGRPLQRLVRRQWQGPMRLVRESHSPIAQLRYPYLATTESLTFPHRQPSARIAANGALRAGRSPAAVANIFPPANIRGTFPNPATVRRTTY